MTLKEIAKKAKAHYGNSYVSITGEVTVRSNGEESLEYTLFVSYYPAGQDEDEYSRETITEVFTSLKDLEYYVNGLKRTTDTDINPQIFEEATCQ